MNSIQSNSPLYLQEEPNPSLLCWLQMVQFHSQNGSKESQNILIELAKNLPSYDEKNTNVLDVIKKVQNFVKKREFDPQISPSSKSALITLSLSTNAIRSLSGKPKPACARKLNFSDDEI